MSREVVVGGLEVARDGWRDSSREDWRAILLCSRSASSGTSTTEGCRGMCCAGRGIEGALEGCSDSSKEDLCARFLCSLSVSSGISTTDGCRWLSPAPLSICTSASLGSRDGRASSPEACDSGAGFERLGSSPAFNAFAIRNA